MEIILRIYYPFPTRIRGDRLELATNITYSIHNRKEPRLDSVITNKKNSIGFRGADPPPDIAKRLSILAFGGSTVACTFLTEGRTWPDRLSLRLEEVYPSAWINNAGIDGYSTSGNLNLLRYYLPTLSFRPRIALFLIGANDVNRKDLDDQGEGAGGNWFSSFKRWGLKHLKTAQLISDTKNSFWPPRIFPADNNSDAPNYTTKACTPEGIDSATKVQAHLLPAFRSRILSILEICKQENISPVLITQPMQVDARTPAGSWKLFWYELQPYNQATRDLALAQGIPCVDLATEMRPDTAFYYDMLHYTNAGAEEVAKIVFRDLRPWIDAHFPGFGAREK